MKLKSQILVKVLSALVGGISTYFLSSIIQHICSLYRHNFLHWPCFFVFCFARLVQVPYQVVAVQGTELALN
jgi:hypothetical protein